MVARDIKIILNIHHLPADNRFYRTYDESLGRRAEIWFAVMDGMQNRSDKQWHCIFLKNH